MDLDEALSPLLAGGLVWVGVTTLLATGISVWADHKSWRQRESLTMVFVLPLILGFAVALGVYAYLAAQVAPAP